MEVSDHLHDLDRFVPGTSVHHMHEYTGAEQDAGRALQPDSINGVEFYGSAQIVVFMNALAWGTKNTADRITKNMSDVRKRYLPNTAGFNDRY